MLGAVEITFFIKSRQDIPHFRDGHPIIEDVLVLNMLKIPIVLFILFI